MTEAAISLMLVTVWLQGVLYFGGAVYVQQQTVAAARYSAFRAMRQEDSTIPGAKHVALFRRNYQLPQGKLQVSKARRLGESSARSAEKAIRGAAAPPMSIAPRRIAANMKPDTTAVTVSATYASKASFAGPLRFRASLTVPGQAWTKEDLGGDRNFNEAEAELAVFGSKKIGRF